MCPATTPCYCFTEAGFGVINDLLTEGDKCDRKFRLSQKENAAMVEYIEEMETDDEPCFDSITLIGSLFFGIILGIVSMQMSKK